jgi:hypothetical protein
MNKRILYLSDFEVISYEVSSTTRALNQVQHFPNTPEGHQLFIEYLQQDIHTPLYYLVDTIQEEYQVISLPHVTGGDRQRLFQHRMKRTFEYTSYTYAVVQGRESQGRGDDRVLFTALSNPELLQPWLSLIQKYKVPLVGIYSAVLLSQQFLKYIPESSHILLVTCVVQTQTQHLQGIRQTFFAKQQLQLSRFVPLKLSQTHEYTDVILEQIVKMQRYLDSARFVPLNTPLSIVILTPSYLYENLQQTVKSSRNDLNISLIDCSDLLEHLGLRIEKDTLWLQTTLAQQLLYGWHKNHYAKPIDKQYFFYRRLRQVIYALSGGLLFTALGYSSWEFYQSFSIRQKGYEITQQITEREKQIVQLREKQMNLPLKIEYIRSIVDAGRYITAHHLLPQPSWTKLSEVLVQHPQLKINHLSWNSDSNERVVADTTVRTKTLPELRNKLIDNKEKSEAKIDIIETIRIVGEIYPFDGNFKVALLRFKRFTNELRKQPLFSEIKEVEIPYDPLALQGQVGGIQDNAASNVKNASFTVDIIVKHPYDKK